MARESIRSRRYRYGPGQKLAFTGGIVGVVAVSGALITPLMRGNLGDFSAELVRVAVGAAVLAAFYFILVATQVPSRRRIRALRTGHPNWQVFGARGYGPLIETLQSAGYVPRSELAPFLGVSFAVTFSEVGIAFWRGSASPHLVASIPSSDIANVSRGVGHSAGQSFVVLEIDAGQSDADIRFPLRLLGRGLILERPLDADAVDLAISQINMLLAEHR